MATKSSEVSKQRLLEIHNKIASRTGDSPTQTIQEIMNILGAQRDFYHWVGVYGLVGDTLFLGPYKGPPTDHVRIPVGRGVCGTAVQVQKNQVIDDVSQLTNYLACNLNTKSEIVVLIWSEDRQQILGQIDVDGSILGAFNREEELFLEEVALLLRPFMIKWIMELTENKEKKAILEEEASHG